MQINNINNSDVNFKMALKIDPKASTKLKAQSQQYLNNIEKIGKELEKIKSYDLFLDKDLKPSVYTHGDTYDILERFLIETQKAGTQYTCCTEEEWHIGLWPDIPRTLTNIIQDKTLANKIFNEIKTKDQISQGVDLVKIMNKYAPKNKSPKKINNKDNAKKLEESEKNAQIKNIIKKYSETQKTATKQKTTTKQKTKEDSNTQKVLPQEVKSEKNLITRFIDFIKNI